METSELDLKEELDLHPDQLGRTEEDRGLEGPSEVEDEVEGGFSDKINRKQRSLEGGGKVGQSWEGKGELDGGLGIKGTPVQLRHLDWRLWTMGIYLTKTHNE